MGMRDWRTARELTHIENDENTKFQGFAQTALF